MKRARKGFTLKPLIAQSGIVLLLVFLILFIRGKQQRVTAQETPDDSIVQEHAPHQIDPELVVDWVDEIERDPFEHPMLLEATSDAEHEIVEEIQQREVLLEAVHPADPRDGLALTSVMLGRVPIAVINGKSLRVGEHFGAVRLIAIEADGVIVGIEDRTERLPLTRLRKQTRLPESESDE